MGKTEAAWNLLSEHLSLRERLRAGEVVQVSARTVSRVTRREPRLMMKFDKRGDRPAPISNATILPISNGDYLIVPGDGYHTIEPVPTTQQWQLRKSARELVTLPWGDTPKSESQLLDMALASGILHEFLDEQDLFLTIRGRLRSPPFEFTFRQATAAVRVAVNGVQVEVDAGLEGRFINLFEAKLGRRSDFHVRQLYYPVRMWSEQTRAKESRAVFVSYNADKVLSLRLYRFDPVDEFGALILEKGADYVFGQDEEGPVASLEEILNTTRPEAAPSGVVFPQADDLVKVLDVIDAAAADITTTAEIVERYGFVARQAHYYPSAAHYLGFVERTPDGMRLTALGREFVGSNRRRRHHMVLVQLAKRPVLREALEYAVREGVVPPKSAISEWVLAETNLSGKTLGRRAQTVRAWTRWAVEQGEQEM